MKIFWKAFFASLLAIIAATTLLILFLVGMISALTSFKDQIVPIKSQSLLILKLEWTDCGAQIEQPVRRP